MGLDNSEVVDAVGTDTGDGGVVLSIIDSWDWEDHLGHLRALQDKLNAYFGFVESGQVYEDYPDAAGKALRIDIVSRYPIPVIGLDFLAQASSMAARLNMTVTHRVP